MNFIKALSIICILLVLSLFSCKQDGGKMEPSPEKQAKAFCVCAKPAVEISGKLASMSPDEREGLISKSQKALQEALLCLNKQEATQKMLAADKVKDWETKYKAAVKSNCPEAVNVLNLNY